MLSMILCLVGGGVVVGCILLEMILAAFENFGQMNSVKGGRGIIGGVVPRNVLELCDRKDDSWDPVTASNSSER